MSDVKSKESLNYTILVSSTYLVLSMYDTSSDGLSLVTVVWLWPIYLFHPNICVCLDIVWYLALLGKHDICTQN